MRAFLFSILLVIAASCNPGVNNKTDSPDTTQHTTTPPPAVTAKDTTVGGCYSQIYNRDTVLLQLDISGNNATGPLTIKIFEKDMNDGSVKAEVADSTIIGWYLFRSEGVMSVRQVAWRIKPGQLWPATGEVIVRNDTTLFADPAKLRFDNSRPLVKVQCSM